MALELSVRVAQSSWKYNKRKDASRQCKELSSPSRQWLGRLIPGQNCLFDVQNKRHTCARLNRTTGPPSPHRFEACTQHQPGSCTHTHTYRSKVYIAFALYSINTGLRLLCRDCCQSTSYHHRPRICLSGQQTCLNCDNKTIVNVVLWMFAKPDKWWSKFDEWRMLCDDDRRWRDGDRAISCVILFHAQTLTLFEFCMLVCSFSQLVSDLEFREWQRFGPWRTIERNVHWFVWKFLDQKFETL